MISSLNVGILQKLHYVAVSSSALLMFPFQLASICCFTLDRPGQSSWYVFTFIACTDSSFQCRCQVVWCWCLVWTSPSKNSQDFVDRMNMHSPLGNCETTHPTPGRLCHSHWWLGNPAPSFQFRRAPGTYSQKNGACPLSLLPAILSQVAIVFHILPSQFYPSQEWFLFVSLDLIFIVINLDGYESNVSFVPLDLIFMVINLGGSYFFSFYYMNQMFHSGDVNNVYHLIQ